jgi:sensor domain CHASE-containing protein
VHKVVHSGNGLDAVVFVDASGRYVVAYRGSETASDWLNNLTSLIRTPSQQREAVRFALELRRELGPDATIDFTGHSSSIHR